ncbi:PAS domain-containing sensor histidine kinase [Methanobacterium sp.]|uniref:PAS domain-containing sensor histidine kinase n=1 Tax=Methanobacterium sp. TaxID=2164 RepID=UPI003C720E81
MKNGKFNSVVQNENENKTKEQLINEIEEYKKTENALRESEERFRLLYENSPLPYQSLNHKGYFIEVNQAFLDVLGYTKEEIIGHAFSDIMTPECACTFNKRFKRFNELGYMRKAEFKLLRKDNVPITILIDGNIEYAPDGTFKQTHCVWIDITDRKLWEEAIKREALVASQTAKALIESEDRYRFLYDHNPSMYFTVDSEALVLSVNQFGAEQLGFKVHELVGQSVLKVFYEEDKDAVILNIKRCVHNLGHLFHWELRKVRKDSSILWVKETARAVKGTDGKITVLIVCEDITELKELENILRETQDTLELKVRERTKELSKCNIRLESDIDEIKRIERALRKSEEKFRALAENSPDIISRLDKELRYKYINHGSNTLGLSSENLIGKKLEDIAPLKGIIKIWTKSAKKVLKTGEIQEMEFKFPSIHGLKVFHSYIVPEYDDGKIESLLVVSHDVTQRKQLEEELKETVKELKHSNEELQQFAYVASHDLQEPLRTITSFTQLIERRYKNKLDSDADEFIEYIVEAAKRMQSLINDLLNYSRVATMKKEFELTDTEEVLKSALNNLNIAIRENNAQITHENLPEIMADPGQMIQLFQNLIGNAIKFRKPEVPPKIHIKACKDENNNEYVFSVQDNGIGMEPQYAERIFTIFQRLHTNEEYDGTGIGLAISKRVVERHDGRIWVESKLGEGSTFYFTIHNIFKKEN